jgi:hypothetical protein
MTAPFYFLPPNACGLAYPTNQPPHLFLLRSAERERLGIYLVSLKWGPMYKLNMNKVEPEHEFTVLKNLGLDGFR